MSSLDRLWDWMNQRVESAAGSPARSVLVIGLGRFGTALASALIEMDVEVMAIDTDRDLVDAWAERLTHVRLADGTSAGTLEQLGATSFDAAVVAIGSDLEASILSTAALSDLGVSNIWAKAITAEHGRILERVGADHVVFPERQMGQRVARVVTGQVLDYFMIDEGFVLAELPLPRAFHGQTLGESDIRSRYSVTVVCIKPSGGRFTYATPDSPLQPGDVILIAGEVADTERFAAFAVRRDQAPQPDDEVDRSLR